MIAVALRLRLEGGVARSDDGLCRLVELSPFLSHSSKLIGLGRSSSDKRALVASGDRVVFMMTCRGCLSAHLLCLSVSLTLSRRQDGLGYRREAEG